MVYWKPTSKQAAVGNMRMEFRRIDGTLIGSMPWRVQVLTFDELRHHAKTALAGFYVHNEHAFWPRRPDAPEEVRIIDANGEIIVAYTIRDMAEETNRVLVGMQHL